MTFTKEQLIERCEEAIASLKPCTGLAETKSLACFEIALSALAGMEAEPVAWRWNYGGTTSWRLQETKPNYGDNNKFPRVIQPLYSAPQPLTTSERAELENYRNAQRVVPSFDEWLEISGQKPLGFVKDTMREAYDACRGAMLQGEADGTLTNEGTIPATQFKPVADLYGITSPTGSETSFTFDAVEARDFIDGGWTCQEYVELERFQDAMTNHSGDANEKVNSPVIPDGCCIMPMKLTAENGAKGALSGEFHVTHHIVCQSCGGEGCEDCNEEGGWDGEILIGWDIIKQIHDAAVKACSLPAAPQQEV